MSEEIVPQKVLVLFLLLLLLLLLFRKEFSHLYATYSGHMITDCMCLRMESFLGWSLVEKDRDAGEGYVINRQVDLELNSHELYSQLFGW